MGNPDRTMASPAVIFVVTLVRATGKLHWMLTVIVEEPLASSEDYDGLRIPSEMDARGSSRIVIFYIGQARDWF